MNIEEKNTFGVAALKFQKYLKNRPSPIKNYKMNYKNVIFIQNCS